MANQLIEYEYTPLSTKFPEIRLLTLHAGNLSSGIEVELSTASLDDEYSSYEALSYTWGNSAPTYSIRIDGCTLKIASNLYHALRHLQEADTKRALWIDAICINQLNLEEKANQVRRMSAIYRKAKRVLCWLDEEVESIGNVFAKLENLAVIEDCPCITDSTEFQLGDGNVWIELQRDPMIWPAIADLLEHSYWKRAWIVQEILNAQDALVMCGKYTITWRAFVKGWGPIFWAKGLGNDKCFARATWLASLTEWNFEKEKKASILDHLQRFRWWQATNPLDMLYAFIGLPCREDTASLRVVYHCSETQLWQMFAKWHISETQTLDVLSYMDSKYEAVIPREARNAPLNSWTPVWTHAYNTVIASSTRKNEHPILHASADTKIPTDLLEWSNDPSKEYLPCIGFEFDRIRQLGDELDLGSGHRSDHRTLEPTNRIMQQWEGMMSVLKAQLNPYSGPDGMAARGSNVKQSSEKLCLLQKLSAEDIEVLNNHDLNCTALIEAFWRTLIADQWPWTTNMKSAREGRANTAVFQYYMDWRYSEDGNTFTPLTLEDQRKEWFQLKAAGTCSYRRYAITEKNYMGLVPAAAEVGDRICIFRGGQVPFVIRESVELQRDKYPQGRFYRCIGECYVHGIMDGEAMEGRISDEKRDTLFYLV